MTSQGNRAHPSGLTGKTEKCEPQCCWCELSVPSVVSEGEKDSKVVTEADNTNVIEESTTEHAHVASTGSGPPPGLEQHGKLVELFSGGRADATDWRNWRELLRFKPFTNAFVCDKKHGRILLGMKKRGFGKDLYNGFGGKVEPNESPMEAAARELKEESGISANLEECGALLFVGASTEYCYHVHMYRAYEYEGEPVETEEMRPHWFAIPKEYFDINPAFKGASTSNALSSPRPVSETLPQIPLEQMWPDDELWMPLLLKGEYFVGRIDFNGIENPDAHCGSWAMERWWFGTKVKE